MVSLSPNWQGHMSDNVLAAVNLSFTWISFHSILIQNLAAVEGKCLQFKKKKRSVAFIKVGTPTRRNHHVHKLA